MILFILTKSQSFIADKTKNPKSEMWTIKPKLQKWASSEFWIMTKLKKAQILEECNIF